MLKLFLVIGGLLLLSAVPPHARSQAATRTHPAPTPTAPRAPLEAATSRPLTVALVRRLYAAAGHEALWLRSGRKQAEQALALLRGAREHGLSPAHYRADELAQRLDGLAANNVSQFDTDLSSAVLEMLTDIHFGRTPAAYAAPGFGPATTGFDPVEALRGAMREDRLADLAEQAQPRVPLYRRVKQTLAQYRRLAALPQQGLPLVPLPGSAALVAGAGYPGAPMLRQRLLLLGDLVAGDDTGDEREYSAELAEAVKRFQSRHGLAEDGELGPATMKALAVPLAHRIRQLELTLERLRWVPPLRPGRIVVVNLPAFRLWAFDTAARPAAPALEMRVIVGKAAGTPTPLFVGQMQYLEFQPYWNVPASIARNEIIPKLARDPGYLTDNDMEIVNRDGKVMAANAPTTLAALDAGAARIRQRPGVRNVLGAVKFAMPNSMNIYLHSTSAADQFARARRDLSHGCIRVERPAELAEFVLADPVRWSAGRVREAMRPGAARTVHLATPLPVVLFYATAVTDRRGRALFADDIYRRDAALLAAMDRR